MTSPAPRVTLASSSHRVEGIRSEENPVRLTHPALSFIKGYWDEKRRGRAMPSRRDINPIDLKPYLPWVVLVDVTADLSDFRYRLIGTRVSEYFLKEMTGKSMSEAFAPFGEAAAKAVVALHRKIARDKVVVRSYGGAGWLGRYALEFDSLYLPLSDDDVHVTMILSAFTFDTAKLTQVRSEAALSRTL